MVSVTMNALRSPSASEIHSPEPDSGCPAAPVCVSRHVPGCGSPIVNGGPGQSGSRQSAPARKEWIVGVTAPAGAASSSVACESTSGTDDSITVCVRKPATPGYASAMRFTDTPGSRSGAARRMFTRRPRRSSFVTLTDWTENASLPSSMPPSESVKSRDPVLQVRSAPRRSTSASVRNGVRDQRRVACALLNSIDAAPTWAWTGPSR